MSKEDDLSAVPPVITDALVEYAAEERSSHVSFLFLGDTPLEIIEYLYSNKIDKDMQEEGELLYTTEDINDWVAKYYGIWENEMNVVFDNLLAQLSGEARLILDNSQASWENMNQYNSYLWYEIFALSKGRGTGDASMVHMQSLGRVRERTFLLAEYYYWLTGDFSFYYI